jgi:hypothetical protein
MKRRRAMRRRARENPDTGVWLAVGAGVVVLGGAIYFLTRPSSSSTAAAQAPGQLPSTNVKDVTLHVGQDLSVQPPPPSAPGQTGWSATETHEFETNGTNNSGAPIMSGLIAARPGRSTTRWVATNEHGLMTSPDFWVNVTVIP